MTTFDPLYLLTLYAPRSVDPDEATVLTPVAGAPHSQPFRVATRHFGRAVRIGATTARYLIRNPVGTWPTTALTIEYYGRLDAAALGSQPNFALSYGASGASFNEILFGLQNSGGTWRPYLEINNASAGTATPVWPTDAKYHHLAARWRSSDGSTQIFLDGVQVLTATLKTGYSLVGAGAFVVGQEQDALGAGFDSAQAWKGEIDEARLYSRFLSDQEIKQHVGGIYIDETGLCGCWGFDLPGVPGLGRDSSSAGNDLTPVGITEGTEDTVLHFYPYLQEPSGYSGRFDPLTRVLETSTYTIGLIDRKLEEGNNLKRWVTAFLGDTQGRNQLLGLKARQEESLDGGLTRAAFFTGRIDLTKLNEKNAYSVPCRNGVDEMDVDIFVGRPHSSIAYAAAPQVWPVGPSATFGGLQASQPIKGKIQAASGFASSTGIKSVLIDSNELSNPRNRMTATLEEVSGSWATATPGLLGDVLGSFFPEGVTFSTRARVKLTVISGGATGQFKLGVVRRGSAPSTLPLVQLGGSGWGNAVIEIVLAELAATDPNYLAMPAVTTPVQCSVILIEEDPDQDAPLLIGDVPAVQLLEDLILGKFGRLKSDGGVLQAFVPEPVSFAQLKADQTIPTFRGVIKKREKLRAWAEQALLRPPYNLGWRLDADNRVVVFDTRRPSSLAGIGTITNADLVEAKDAFKWEQTRQGAITQLEGRWYVDLPVGPDGAVVAPARMNVSPTLLLRSVVQNIFDITFGRTDMGQKRETFDAIGFRAMPGELVQGQSRAIYTRQQLERGLEEIRAMFSTGPAEATIRTRRTANTKDWHVGQMKIIDVDPMPDPGTNLRGGARLMIAVARDVKGPEIKFSALDLGPNVIAAAPTSASLAQDTDDTAHGFSLAVTLNAAGDPVILEYAITDAAVVVRPVETDPLWTFARRLTTSATVKVINLPAGKKAWPRHRSVPASETSLQLPSVWSFPTTTESVTLASITAPSGLGTTELSGKRVVITFTPGETRLPTEVMLATPVGDARVRVKTVPPGATRFELVDLTVSTTYRLGLRHRDSLGGLSTEPTIDFTTTGTPATAPDPGGIAILIGAA